MAKWRTKLFMKLYASALEAAQFYRLPAGRVVELGSQTGNLIYRVGQRLQISGFGKHRDVG